MMAERKRQRRTRFDKVVFLKMPSKMYERLQEFAERSGQTVSAVIRFIVSEWLREAERGTKRTERERERE